MRKGSTGSPRRWWALSGLLAGSLVLVALWALPQHIQAGDAGEFATVMLRGGVPHPSGYPWMRMLGPLSRGLEQLGVASVFAAALPCAMAGAAAWVIMHRTLVRSEMPRSGLFAVLLAAFAAPTVLHVNDVEVWGVHLLFASVFVHQCFATQKPRALVLGLVLGLAVSHHLSAILLIPLAVGAAWPPSPSARRVLESGAIGVTGAVVGLLPYATLMLGPGGAWRWGETRSITGLVRHVLRQDYGVFSLSLHTETPPVLDQYARVLENIGGALTAGLLTEPVLVAALLLAAFAAVMRRPPGSVRRSTWWGLGASVLATTVAFPAAHNIDPHNVFGAWILERFDLLTLLLWTPLIAAGGHRLAGFARHRALRVGLYLLGVTLVAGQLVRASTHGRPRTSEGVERYARDVLTTPDPQRRALVFGTDDHRLFPILYAQEILGEGERVLYIDASLLSQPWYRRQLRLRWPDLPEADKPLQLMGVIWSDPARQDTPIYMTNLFSRPSTQLPRVPEGVLWRVVPPNRGTEHGPEVVFKRHLAALNRYHGVVASDDPGHPWSGDLAARYAEGTQQLIGALETGNRPAAAEALRAAFADLVSRARP